MELGNEALGLLRDEAYITLCREAIHSHLELRNRQKTPSLPLPPPPIEKSSPGGPRAPVLAADRDPEIALYARLTRINRIEAWLQHRLRTELIVHLERTNPTFQYGIRIQQALNEWEFCVRHVLPDSLAEFARELRGLRQLVTEPRACAEASRTAELLSLRRIARRVEDQQLQISRIAASVAGHAQQIGATDVLPPPLPNFRRIVWVDWLSVVPADHLVVEVTRIEGEVRDFLNRGLAAALDRLQASRNAGTTRQEMLLQEYWRRLREHAQSHFVEESELDVVLDSLSYRYEPEIVRHEGTRIRPLAEV